MGCHLRKYGLCPRLFQGVVLTLVLALLLCGSYAYGCIGDSFSTDDLERGDSTFSLYPQLRMSDAAWVVLERIKPKKANRAVCCFNPPRKSFPGPAGSPYDNFAQGPGCLFQDQNKQVILCLDRPPPFTFPSI